MTDKDIDNQEQPRQDTSAGEARPEQPRLRDRLKSRVTEEDAPLSASLTLRKILGGDFLTAAVIRKQIGLIILIAAFVMVYVSNRYSCQQDLLEIEELKEKIKDAKYKALASTSELTEMCRESNVLDMLRNNADSVLQIPTQPPYIINIPENEQHVR